jgi:midasin
MLINVYVTNIPIDPAVRRILQGEVLASRHRLLLEEIYAIECAELATKGKADSVRLDDLRAQRNTLEQDIAAQEPITTRSSDATRLAVLFNEVHTFLQDIMEVNKVLQLTAALESGHTQGLQREDAFQQATGAFLQRLQANYADLDDLIRPIVLSILSAKFGMGCLVREMDLQQGKRSNVMVAALTFPTIAAASKITAETEVQRDDVLGQTLVAAAATHESTVCGHQAAGQIDVRYLDGLYATWSAVRMREQEDAADAESLYRVRKTEVEVLSDLEEEEKEFKELFPTYDDVDEAPTNASSTVAEKTRFSSARVVDFHNLVMTASQARSDTGRTDQLFSVLIDEVLNGQTDLSAYDESLDRTSRAYQLRKLHRRRTDISTSPAHANFYLSPNEPEIRKAHSIISRLMVRLDALIAEWPEQMVPQHIRDRCERILKLDVQSPVAMILTAVEQLLTHTEDWEAYANRENSLKSFQEEMTNLIIEWRRLELSSWMRLLEDQVGRYVQGDAEWTLRLYGALVHGVTSAEDVGKHIEEVMPMLSQYLQNSTFGHFAPRLTVLERFQNITHRLSETDGPAQAGYKRMSIMLDNTIANARLFSTRITESLQLQRATIDKSIKDFVRLASWKDVNVYALKASAVKSHRQLHRSVRKFKEVLQQPVSPILGDLNSVVPQDGTQGSTFFNGASLDVGQVSDAGVEARSRVDLPIPTHIVKLEETFTRYSTILAKHSDNIDATALAGQAMDDMATEVIESAAALAKETPSTLTKENKKIVNNLASRKRKAYSDLLKALRASGFSANVRADMMAKQQSTTWLAGRESLVVVGGVDVGKIESYRHRLGVLMTALRRSFNGHNDDIASGDLERGIGFSESLYATALTERDL